MMNRDEQRSGPNYFQPFPKSMNQPSRLEYADEDRARIALMHLRDSGWPWQAAMEKISRDMRLVLAAIERQCCDLRWQLPPMVGAVKRSKTIVTWILQNEITQPQEWPAVQDHWCVSRSNAQKFIAAANRIRSNGSPVEDKEPILLHAAQWLRSPVKRPGRELRAAIVDLYQTRGPTYYASRP